MDRKLIWWGLALFILVVIGVGGSAVEVSTHHSYLDLNTGSWKFYSTNLFGTRSADRIQISPLEQLVREKRGASPIRRWTFVSGTGKNLFGRSFVFRDGVGGSVSALRPEFLKRWMERHTQEEALDLHDFLSRADIVLIEKKLEEMGRQGSQLH